MKADIYTSHQLLSLLAKIYRTTNDINTRLIIAPFLVNAGIDEDGTNR